MVTQAYGVDLSPMMVTLAKGRLGRSGFLADGVFVADVTHLLYWLVIRRLNLLTPWCLWIPRLADSAVTKPHA